MRATGEVVHPTVRSFVSHNHHPGVTTIPIRDLPPSETALVWLATSHSRKIQAFARAAADVLAAQQDHDEPPDRVRESRCGPASRLPAHREPPRPAAGLTGRRLRFLSCKEHRRP